MKICKNIELELKRKKRFKWGPREIDLDILYYEDLVFEDENLKIPHKYIFERDFVIVPLNDISPDWVHPIYKKSIKQRYDEIDKSKIKLFSKEL